MKRTAWPRWKVALFAVYLFVGLVFFWLGVGWWIIPAAAVVAFVALSY
jgi:hypothetical protein